MYHMTTSNLIQMLNNNTGATTMKTIKAIQATKEESNTMVIQIPKQRGWMPPPTKSFKNRYHEFKNSWHKN